MSVLSVLAGAAGDVNNFGDTRGGAMAGPLGLLIIVLLSIATVLLIRNMNKRLRRLPSSFEKPGAAGGTLDSEAIDEPVAADKDHPVSG
ncbi:MAG: hypothetical protein QOJ50_657 [Cryptosporangiaceae bacterium]|nr:hypothetical protein [Cryptosporangiaceae bacterium]